MAQQQTPALLVHASDHGESDKIVTFYSPIIGKLTGIAKGAKRSKKRFVNKLEPFSLLNLQYNDKYALPIIEQAELINSHLYIRENFKAYTAASLLCELIKHWTHENDGDEYLFHCLLWAFNELNGPNNTEKTIILFLSKFYGRLGYQLDISGCQICHRLEAAGSPFNFKADHGAITCHRCQRTQPQFGVAINTIKLLNKAFELPLEKLTRLQFDIQSSRESLRLFCYYDHYLLDREIQSWNFLLSAHP